MPGKDPYRSTRQAAILEPSRAQQSISKVVLSSLCSLSLQHERHLNRCEPPPNFDNLPQSQLPLSHNKKNMLSALASSILD